MTLCDIFTEPKHNLNQTVKFEPNLENRVRGFPALPLKLVKLNNVAAGCFGSRRQSWPGLKPARRLGFTQRLVRERGDGYRSTASASRRECAWSSPNELPGAAPS